MAGYGQMAIEHQRGPIVPNLVPGLNCCNTHGGGSIFVVVTPYWSDRGDLNHKKSAGNNRNKDIRIQYQTDK